MKILLIITMILCSSCSMFSTKQKRIPNINSISLKKQTCLLKFYEMGMGIGEAIKSCNYILGRKK